MSKSFNSGTVGLATCIQRQQGRYVLQEIEGRMSSNRKEEERGMGGMIIRQTVEYEKMPIIRTRWYRNTGHGFWVCVAMVQVMGVACICRCDESW